MSDRRVVKLVRRWLQAAVREDGEAGAGVAGTAQGGVISPLLADIDRHALDRAVVAAGVGELVRYADDGVVRCRRSRQVEAALALVEEALGGLGLRLHPGKTRIVDLDQGREGCGFLGWHFPARMSGRLWAQKRIVRSYLHRWPNVPAMTAIRLKIKDRTGRNRGGVRDVRVLIAELNPILPGWRGYFLAIDRYVCDRLGSLLRKKRGGNLRPGQADRWTEDWFNPQGLYHLPGTVRSPQAA